MAILTAVLWTPASCATVIPPVFPIRIFKSKTSNQYLVVLSTKANWLDHDDESEDSYDLKDVILLWGAVGKLGYLYPSGVTLHRKTGATGWMVGLWVGERERGKFNGQVFVLPNMEANDEPILVRHIENSNIVSTEILESVDVSDPVYRGFHEAARAGVLGYALSIKGKALLKSALKRSTCASKLNPPIPPTHRGNKTIH